MISSWIRILYFILGVLPLRLAWHSGRLIWWTCSVCSCDTYLRYTDKDAAHTYTIQSDRQEAFLSYYNDNPYCSFPFIVWFENLPPVKTESINNCVNHHSDRVESIPAASKIPEPQACGKVQQSRKCITAYELPSNGKKVWSHNLRGHTSG